MAEQLLEFEQLLQRSRAGDQAALTQLVQQYEREVRIAARVLLGPALRPHLDSLDLVQSVHRSLLFGLHHQKFDIAAPDRLLALALTIVRRKVARHWRRHQRQKRSMACPPTARTYPLSYSPCNHVPTTPRAAQFNDQVEHLCQHLSESERTIMEMRLDGYATAEIADRLGLSGVALRVRMTRLRQRLQEAGVLEDWL